ncbi:MAG: type II secretion system protein [Gallionella sp.]|nr:type II secretion system protein [Gallionella sp.]
MIESQNRVRVTISEEIMLARLAQSEQMRAFFIEMWKQNPALAKQGGVKVRNLLTQLERVDLEAKPFSPLGKGREGGKQRGISLIELIMFIVIVSVALAGILLVMNVTTRSSADPLIRKQALAIAESLLEEVELMPFTFCDPDDPAAGLATTVDTTACTVPVGGEAIGPEGAETRYSAATPFDNVSDYHGFNMAAGALLDIGGAAVGPAGYAVAVAVANNGMPAVGASPAIAAAEALLITVTVTGPDGVPVVVEGMRTRYSPRI